MKITAKVFIILSMVLAALGFILYLIVFGINGMDICEQTIQEQKSSMSAQELYDATLLTLIIVGVIVVGVVETVGGLAIRRLNRAAIHSELVGIGIVTLIFCSLVGGILMLCIPDSALSGN
jgi:heme/copper-type cytochrome/quinol oxidase subunit 2